ncbi:hypothetical protein LCGC14_1171120 [marine sediment metagenome]|uniref:FHA domain-containing protein n=1 Tax=marine sediment metagenome TaxID=412755 RepID=A0A0F9LUP1_9ZZZZ
MMKVDLVQRGGRHDRNNMILVLAARFIGDQLDGMDDARVHVEVTGSKLTRRTLGRALDAGDPRGRDGWYTIQLKKDMPFLSKIVTLAHELVHVSQYVTGRLTLADGCVTWEGSYLGSIRLIPYLTRPWEVEAFGNETKLAKQYLAWEEQA